MTQIPSLDALISALTGPNAEKITSFKDPRIGAAAITAPVAGQWIDLWEWNGIPSHGAWPGTTAVSPDNTTDGGLKQADPGGGRQKWLTAMNYSIGGAGTLMLYDRLQHVGGLSGTVITAQTWTTTALTRYTNGLGNLIFVYVNGAIGATNTTATVRYTDDAGNANIDSQAFSIGGTGRNEAGRLMPVPLAAGDRGVQAITNLDLVASTLTAGNIGLVVAHPLGWLSVNTVGGGWEVDFISGVPKIPEILTDACLSLAYFAASTASPVMMGDVQMVEY